MDAHTCATGSTVRGRLVTTSFATSQLWDHQLRTLRWTGTSPRCQRLRTRGHSTARDARSGGGSAVTGADARALACRVPAPTAPGAGCSCLTPAAPAAQAATWVRAHRVAKKGIRFALRFNY